jgi:hypothetical protein
VEEQASEEVLMVEAFMEGVPTAVVAGGNSFLSKSK